MYTFIYLVWVFKESYIIHAISSFDRLYPIATEVVRNFMSMHENNSFVIGKRLGELSIT